MFDVCTQPPTLQEPLQFARPSSAAPGPHHHIFYQRCGTALSIRVLCLCPDSVSMLMLFANEPDVHGSC